MSSPSPVAPAAENSGLLACRLCGRMHRLPPLAPGERALCVRCGTMLAKRGRFGADAPLAFTITGLALAFPALTQPIAEVSKFRNEHVAIAITGARALWRNDMRLLAIWVALCGVIAPVVLLACLAGLSAPPDVQRQIPGMRFLRRLAEAVEHWAMPEVHVLAVLVAFTKLGTLVDVRVGPGLWCYAAMSLMILLAWRNYDFVPFAAEPAHARPAPRPGGTR